GRRLWSGRRPPALACERIRPAGPRCCTVGPHGGAGPWTAACPPTRAHGGDMKHSTRSAATPTMPDAAATLARPASLTALFVAFSRLALQGFGGVLAVAQRELVDRRTWLTRHEFIELYAVAQLLPGPNVVNLSLMIGDRYFGWRGALAAVSGMLLAPILG